jgi:hypothetical protein
VGAHLEVATVTAALKYKGEVVRLVNQRANRISADESIDGARDTRATV